MMATRWDQPYVQPALLLPASYSRPGFRLHLVSGFAILVTCLLAQALAGSRMVEPPTRPSLWRYGFGTKVNFDDDEINCGGFERQYGVNEGKCGVCGDAWEAAAPRQYEAGSATFPIARPVRVYNKGSDVFVAVESSSDLVGKYEFRICKLNSSDQTPDQSCFDATPLSIREAELDQSYRIGQSGGLVSLHLVLPPDLVCQHCILQWRHVTGNRVNKSPESCVQCSDSPAPQCHYCLGCGAQSWYQGCSDIAVIDTMGSHPALLGVKSQEALKQQWSQTLKEMKANCTSGTNVGGSDNTINGSYP